MLYYFFKDNRQDHSVARALCAMVHQLWSLDGALSILIHDTLKKRRPESLLQDPPGLTQILIECLRSTSKRPIYFVIDAFDECRDADQDQLIDSLEAILGLATATSGHDSQQACCFKVLLTSRGYFDLQCKIRKISKHFTESTISGQESLHTTDINKVIDDKIKQLEENEEVSPDVLDFVQQKLKSTHNHNYLVVDILFKEFKGRKGNEREDFDCIINWLPNQLTEAYEKLLSRKQEYEDEIRTVLKIVLAACRPLSIQEINVATKFSLKGSHHETVTTQQDILPARDANYYRSLCGFFIIVIDETLHLTHQKAKEFLLEREGNIPRGIRVWQNSFQARECHAVLGAVCVELWRRRTKGLLLFDYAVRWWPYHLQRSPQDARETLIKGMENDEELMQRILGGTVVGMEKFIRAGGSFEGLGLAHPLPPTIMSRAAMSGYPTPYLMEHLLRVFKMDPNTQQRENWSILHKAVFIGDLEVVKILIDYGADLSVANLAGDTPLCLALDRGHVEVGKVLIEKGTAVSAAPTIGWTPLHMASNKGYVDIVEMLLEKDADVSSTTKDNWTPLHMASSKGHFDIVKVLLEKGADISAANEHGWTPLCLASYNGHVDMVKLLLKNAANVSAANKYGSTPLHVASNNGHVEVVHHLLGSRANPLLRDLDRDIALYTATSGENSLDVLRLLARATEDYCYKEKMAFLPFLIVTLAYSIRARRHSTSPDCEIQTAYILELLIQRVDGMCGLQNYRKSTLSNKTHHLQR